MGDSNIVYSVLGMFIALGLANLLFAPRMPAMTNAAFRELPADVQRKRLRRTRRAGVTLIVVGSLAFVGFAVVQGWTKARLARRPSLETVADNLNQSLPRMVAPGARWESVTVEPGRVLAYSYTLVDKTADHVDRAAMAAAAKQLPAQMCGLPDAREALRSGATLKFAYQDKDHRPVADYQLSAADCP